VELVLQTDGQTVERADGLPVRGEIVVELLSIGEGRFEEDFMQTVDLSVRLDQPHNIS
jgi:hypothetical protein